MLGRVRWQKGRVIPFEESPPHEEAAFTAGPPLSVVNLVAAAIILESFPVCHFVSSFPVPFHLASLAG